MSKFGHKHAGSVVQNQKAQLASAYNDLGKELSSTKIKVVGNYTLGKAIGEGAYGKVRLGTHRLTSTRVAIKQIPKALSATLTREIHHHRQLHHPHVTQLYEVIATENTIWLVTELCSGGELFDYLTEKGRISEDETRIVFGQICLAVNYLHEKGIVHRDLKLENVLLDERCRVKLGDFGFTREFERGTYLETFCGTTGYASPEMLEGKKYLGPEVDVWSLGVILYTLLTGVLPFDDDDEAVMRAKVIKGEFEDPEWLSPEIRDLIKRILTKDTTDRITIPQILAHPWFTMQLTSPTSVTSPELVASPLPIDIQPSQATSASSATSDSSFRSASSELDASSATSPDDDSVEDHKIDDVPHIHRNPSQSTIRKAGKVEGKKQPQPETVMEEEPIQPLSRPPSSRSPSKGPPALPTRTPVRTKRRSVSSTLSDPSSPTSEHPSTPISPQDFGSLLNTPAPIIFSTPLERELLNSLSALGFDTGQMVHSVLSNACDAAGAMWWMLKRRAERKAIEEGVKSVLTQVEEHYPEPHETTLDKQRATHSPRSSDDRDSTPHGSRLGPPLLMTARSAPELAFIPATPTVPTHPQSTTPPRVPSPAQPFLSPTISPAELVTKSTPSTPAGSMKDKDSKDGSKGRREGKMRSGSVSIMQRATTALEAAGLVRKKSTEAVKDDKTKEKDKESERRNASTGDEPRNSYASSGKLTKSPPSKVSKEIGLPTSVAVDSELASSSTTVPSSPWVITGANTSPPGSRTSTPAHSPGDTLTSLPRISENGMKGSGHRNRASLLSAFRMWFNEDRKGKRKEGSGGGMPLGGPFVHPIDSRPPSSAGFIRGTTKVKRRASGGNTPSRKGHRPKGHSISSHRSSSVNSRRSSNASMQMMVESPQFSVEHMTAMSRQRSDPSRRSFGSRTPNSERGDYVPSRPSSVHSFNVKHRHRKSPSASSAGSIHVIRTASPYHKRGGSGSSTRVVRSPQHVPQRPGHLRSNSTTSSIHSLTSSRPTSFYEPSDSEAQRTGSPFRSLSRSTNDETPRRGGNSTFVAQKRQTPFLPPASIGFGSSISRSSWKKSWGLEPPGWQTRTAHLPIEVLSVSPVGENPPQLRDVISGRPSLTFGDDDEWVDEDDDVPFFAGLGQTPHSATFGGGGAHSMDATFGGYPMETPMLGAPPRATAGRPVSGKRATGSSSRSKPGQSPIGRLSPLPADGALEAVPEARGGRRQLPNKLPNNRPGPTFRQTAIQEEDEGEEE
ncbi:Pkinase-domain-containing protein [Artomyces pyxidatus]|uniref:Pkinase-domain-containing protein n=1 Tax=Artomyces pyxidatus TaxID=48021 RepID=A0ACB8SMR5_9AGAM|nr:Pkinase-domain-containing protein [Artomyces pyxidatus]